MCPLRPARGGVRNVHWYTDEVEEARRAWLRASRKDQRTNNEADRLETQAKQHVLRGVIRRAKRQSWQKFCNEIETPKGVAILSKAVQGRSQKVLGQLKRPDGSLTESMEDTMEELFREHFPGCLDACEVPPEVDLR